MSSRSASEGEIVESSEQKANTTSRQYNDNNINRRSRISDSPPQSPRYSDRDRNRSRSPYRHGNSPRGLKRRYEDRERPDPRRHQVRYEDRYLLQKPISYADIDNGEPPTDLAHMRGGQQNNLRGSQYNGRSGRGDHSLRGSRSGSRSPYRADHNINRDNDSFSGKFKRIQPQQGKSHRNERAGIGYSRSIEQSVSDWGNPSLVPNQQSRYLDRRDFKTPQLKDSSSQRIDETAKHAHNSMSSNADIEVGKTETSVIDFAEPVVEDEASIEALRAEKRRKREAIRARLAEKSSDQPLLQQVLVGNTSETVTPAPASPADRSETSVSPTIGSPDLTMQDSAPGSPADFAISKDEGELESNRNVTTESGGDGPSAADYDPTLDMEEDRVRATTHKHGQADLSSSAYDEMVPEQREVLLPASDAPLQVSSKKQKKEKKEFDMFAESDDEDDMFAPGNDDEKIEGEPSMAAPIPQGRELDQSMLDNWDDEQGYYRIIPRELIGGRYLVQETLGKGVFSGVIRAKDRDTGDILAIKIIRKNEVMKKAGIKEIDILKKLVAADPDDKKHVIRFKSSFEHKGHLCMVFENLDLNLRDLLKKVGAGRGLAFEAVREYARQIFLGLALLKKCDILHADLKPDNILVNDNRKSLKICDLGSAADIRDNNEITPYLVSRFYRAPEIILGMKYDFAIDMWSIGCTLYELWTGKILFTGSTNNQMLRSIMECRGKFSLKFLKKGELAGNHFNDRLEFCSREKDPFGRDVARYIVPSTKPARDLKTRVFDAAKDIKNGPTQNQLNLFVDLLDKCLNLNPEKRISPSDALKHPFFLSKTTTSRPGPISRPI